MKTLKLEATALALSALFILFGSGELAARPSNSLLNLANPTTNTTDSLALGYSTGGTTQAAGIVTVNNGTKQADNRPYCVVFTLLNPGQQGGLSFGLVNASNGSSLSLTGSPTSVNQVLSGTFASGTKADTSTVFPIAFQVYPGVLPPPGTYTAVIQESLYGGSTFPPSGSALDSNSLTVTITVGSFYDLSVVATGSSFALDSTGRALDFGIIAAGQRLGADILVRSNVSYSLSLSSANRGALVNAIDSTSSIKYALDSNGSRVVLDPGPGSVASGAAPTYGTPSRYAILVTILPFVSYPSAGSYADTIVVNLAAP